MAHYSIKDLEKLSNVKAHTIRIWEKRYDLIQPERTDTNIRTYSDEELKKLLNIVMLNNNGWKISKIAKLRHDEMNSALNDLTDTESSFQVNIDSLVVAMVDLDRRKFEKILADCTLRMGFEDTCVQVLYPFLQKVGLMWLTDSINPAQEHFISNLIRQKLYVAIDALYTPDLEGKPKVVMYLPEGEMHEMGLLFYRYLMERRGYNTIYLGQSVPFNDAVYTAKAHQADFVVVAFVASITMDKMEAYLSSLSSKFEGKQIIATGGQVAGMTAKIDRVSFCATVPQFVARVEELN